MGMEDRLPDPQLYGAWKARQARAEEDRRSSAAIEALITKELRKKEDASMKRKKTHTGTYHCANCFIEFELVAEESLKCDQCRGPLAPGSLEEVWAEDADEED